MATKAAPKLSPFYVEGEDSIAGYDASAGIIETFTARRFLIDKAGAAANTLKGLDFPVDIHHEFTRHGSGERLVGNGRAVARIAQYAYFVFHLHHDDGVPGAVDRLDVAHEGAKGARFGI